MPRSAPIHRPAGMPTRAEQRKVYDAQRPSSTERGYNARWRKARETFLRRRPLCAMCEEAGRVRAATVVDHIKPHNGDSALFWDTSNWQPLCKPHHDGAKQAEERRARAEARRGART